MSENWRKRDCSQIIVNFLRTWISQWQLTIWFRWWSASDVDDFSGIFVVINSKNSVLSAAFVAVCGLTMLLVVKTFTLLNDKVTYWLHWSVGMFGKSISVCLCIECNPGQVVNTHVPLSPSSITWYQPMVGDALWAGKVTVGLASHWPRVTDISGSPPTGSRPGRGRWAPTYAVLWSTLL